MNPLVSIIIPTYNRAYLISDTVISLIRQSYSNIEILVVDDHSSDNTDELIADLTQIDQRISYHKRPLQKPKGANACRNYGFSICKGEYVKWVDSDDTLAADSIEKQLSILQKSNADLCISRTQIFTVDDNRQPVYSREWGNINEDITPESFILRIGWWHTSSGLWKKKYFKNEDIWDEELMNAQEWLMHFDQICKGVNIVKIYEYLSYARVHSQNVSNAKQKKGEYYYNLCIAIIKAIDIAQETGITNKKIYKKFAKKFFWHFMFTIYKGAPLMAIKLLKHFFKFIRYI